METLVAKYKETSKSVVEDVTVEKVPIRGEDMNLVMGRDDHATTVIMIIDYSK